MKMFGAAVILAAVAACAPPTASSVQVPLSCVFLGTNPPVVTEQVAVVTVTAPEQVLVGQTFPVSFHVELPGLSPTTLNVFNLTFSHVFDVAGPVSVAGGLQFDQAPTSYAAGQQVAFETFSTSFTATSTGVMAVSYLDTDYSFAFSEVGNSVLTDCTSSTPVAVATVDVLG